MVIIYLLIDNYVFLHNYVYKMFHFYLNLNVQEILKIILLMDFKILIYN